MRNWFVSDIFFMLHLNWIIFTPGFSKIKIVSGDLDLVIFHTSDAHARYEARLDSITGKYFGGVARVAYTIKAARKKYKEGDGPPILYLEAGNMFTGSIWFLVHSYEGVAKILNELQPDAFNIGAHEFDLKIEGLTNFTKLVNFPLINTNIRWNDEVEPKKKIKSSIIKVIDGVKVGIVGYLRSELILWAEKGSIDVLDIITELKKECNRLTYEEDVKVIIALGQAHFDTDIIIAYAVEQIDLIVGGGSNTFLYNGIPPDTEIPIESYPTTVTRRDGSLALIIHAYHSLKYIGKLNLRFTEDGLIKGFYGSPILLDANISEDPEMTELVDEMKTSILAFDQRFLSNCHVYLDGTTCQYQECNFGNLVVDAFVEYRAKQYQGPGWTDAAVALMNSDSLISDINAPKNGNKIYYGDVMRALPYSEIIYIVEIKGADLLGILEISTAHLDLLRSKKGDMLLTAGLKIMFDLESRFGERVKLVKVRCGECDVPEYFLLELEKRYKVIITSYLLKGDGVFTIIRDVVWNPIPIGKRDVGIMIDYLQRASYIIPEVGGRLLPYDRRLLQVKSNCFSFRNNFSYFLLLLTLMIT
nr:protein 5NUC-like isoform X1 [Onthophagus taurus]XP_022910386.1 protein 5NUC-like isoform X1 [Onthophagus taurus]XP_022910387.1 protein 5NUC-like isoform X1 [Onthophagus taurus]XP_022910390.1 protein 5NUC-like isoform X1 [Onthophagus taurus]XP_022910391.1 protein 5NUC-like isoform X1 [Onthophagus taurus]